MKNLDIKIFDLKEQYKQISEEIEKDVLKVLRSGQYILGPNVIKIEKKFSKFLNTKYAISCNSGTDALLISLKCLGIKKNDEVITSPFTYFATAEVIAQLGAKPIFADINIDTFNLDPTKIEKLITKKTKAIIPVHIFGQPADMNSIIKIANQHKLKVIEDCAQSFGSKIKSKMTGTFGNFGCFSFFPTKNLGTAGDGGMIITNNQSYYNKALKLRNHGSLERNIHNYLGYNSRLDEIQAAILNIKMKYITIFNKKRNMIANYYKKNIKNNRIITQKIVKDNYNVYHQYTIRVKNRKKFTNYLQEHNIPFGVYYPKPLYMQKAFSGIIKVKKLLNVEKICKECVSLPIYPELDNLSIEYISSVINKYK